MARHLLGLLICTLLATTAEAAQIVALDIKPVGDVTDRLAASLTPLMIAEVGRRQGVSVVSQFDVRAFLEHEGDRQMLGCDDTSCMTSLAGALGAELLLASTLARIDDNWICTISLIRVESAQVVRREVGQHRGSEGAATTAVTKAINRLFQRGLPADLEGPTSMSQRGFEAVFLGFGKAALDPSRDPKPLRKRLIVDLVNTELDFDVEKKMALIVNKGTTLRGEIKRQMLLAEDEQDLRRLLRASALWYVVLEDVDRVREIRKRARERGLVPSARALRFEDPKAPDWPPLSDIAAYRKEAKKGQAVVEHAFAAMRRGDYGAFKNLWLTVRHSYAKSRFDGMRDLVKNGYRYDLLPLHATSPGRYASGIKALKANMRLSIYVRQFHNEQLGGVKTINMRRQEGAWKIDAW